MFGIAPAKGMSIELQEKLKAAKTKQIEYQYRPSKYQSTDPEPIIVKKKPRIFTAGCQKGRPGLGGFGHNGHSSWDRFKETISSK